MMSIENKLKQHILENYKSIRSFTTASNIPYSTVDTMFKRGIGGTGINTIMKICNTLSIDLEDLANGKITKKTNNKIDTTGLTNHEKNLIESYRNNPEMQNAVDKLLGIENVDEMPKQKRA